MSIRIIPQDELGSSEKRTAEAIPPLLFPRLKNLYNRRAERLRELAANNPLGDYLRFAALIAHAQEVVLYDHPLQMDLTARIKAASEQGKPPLDIHVLPRDKHWHKLLHSLIAELKPEMSGPALAVIENLEKASEQELEQMASALFVSDFASVSSDKAPFIWAALSLYWAQMASLIPGKARAEYGEQRQFCPVCGSMPVSSIVQIGTTQGLRYLHCNLCETGVARSTRQVQQLRAEPRPALLVAGQRAGGGESRKLRRLRNLPEDYVSGEGSESRSRRRRFGLPGARRPHGTGGASPEAQLTRSCSRRRGVSSAV